MISFFKVNIPIRILALLVLLVLIRLPLITSGVPLIVPEITWMLVGEKISTGALMYRDVWDNTGPLAALVYGGIHLLFGKSQLAYQIIAMILTAGHILLFNYYMNRDDMYPDKSYLPGLMYLLVSNLFPDFLTLSPVLMSITFLLPALHIVFRHIRVGLREDTLYMAGFCVGLAALFYLPSWIFIVLPLLSFLLYTGTEPRQYALISFGFALPVLLVGLFFLWYDELGSYIQNYLITFLALDTSYMVNLRTLVVIIVVPGILSLMALVKMVGSTKYTNYQSIGQVVMIIWLVLGIVGGFFAYFLTPYYYTLLVPGIAFLLAQLFTLIRKRWQAELFFAVLAFSVIGILYGSNFDVFLGKSDLQRWPLFVKETPYDAIVTNKKVLVLGSNPSVYKNSSLATPYLNWQLAHRHFDRLDRYSIVLNVYKNFSTDLPEVIIDSDTVIPALFDRMPLLKVKYEKGQGDMYVLKAPEAKP